MLNWYIARLKMQSASGTLWQADTIFGHLCWALRYLEGEKALDEFLYWYGEGLPPLLVSNGFPGDLLPVPLLKPAPSPVSGALREQYERFEAEKRRRRTTYVSQADFSRLLRGEPALSIAATNEAKAPLPRATLKNQISRLTGTTGDGGQLFPFEEYWWDTVTIYLKIETGFEKQIESLFAYLKNTGYGKRKSAGYGQISTFTFQPFAGFGAIENANGFASLSNFVPAQNDPIQGSWRLSVKYGKLSEGYATDENIFKKPCLMLEAGSTFYDSPCREFYGGMVKKLSAGRPEVVQYGFALPVPMTLP